MAEKYQSILERTEGMTFPWVVAVKLVGGKKRLERLMAESKVRYDKPFGAQNTHWQFDATDILSNVKPLPVRKALNFAKI
jgi:hypothetical protein